MTNTTKMMADAYRLKKAIEDEIVEVEENGIKIVMGGNLKVKKISLNNSEDTMLKDVVNSAIRKVQELQVLKMKEMVDLKSLSQ